MIAAFIQFKDAKGNVMPQEGVYAVFDNGMIRSALPVEWYELRTGDSAPYAHAPVRVEPIAEKTRYQAYDNALRG